MKDLSYYHIMYGGVPMTPAGRLRFIKASAMAGHPADKIKEYLERLQ